MPLHPQAAAFLAALPEDDGQLDIQQARKRPARPCTTHLPPGAVRADVIPADRAIPIRCYRGAPGDELLPVVVHYHGGGFCIGSLDSHDDACRRIAVGARCLVIAVDYALAPEHRFPAAAIDATTALTYIAEHAASFGGDLARIAVAGDSAGGDLAAVAALHARDTGIGLAHQLLICPNTDGALDLPSVKENGTGYGLTAAGMADFLDYYIDEVDRMDPRIAVLRVPDLVGLAAATVITAEFDILRDEGEAYAHRMADAGVAVELRRYDGMIHNFTRSPDIFDAAQDAERWMLERLRVAFAG